MKSAQHIISRIKKDNPMFQFVRHSLSFEFIMSFSFNSEIAVLIIAPKEATSAMASSRSLKHTVTLTCGRTPMIHVCFVFNEGQLTVSPSTTTYGVFSDKTKYQILLICKLLGAIEILCSITNLMRYSKTTSCRDQIRNIKITG